LLITRGTTALSFSSFIEYCLCRLWHLFSSELCSLSGAPWLHRSPLLLSVAYVNFTTLPFLALLIMRGTTASPFSSFIEYSLCWLQHLFSSKLCLLSGALRLCRSSLLLSLACVSFDTSSFPSFAHYQRCHSSIKVCCMFPWAWLCQDLIQLRYHFLYSPPFSFATEIFVLFC